MSCDMAWRLIDADVPRAWELYDEHGRWFGRAVATSVEHAIAEATDWLCDSARWCMLDNYDTTVTVRCLATDERARSSVTVTTTNTKDTQ